MSEAVVRFYIEEITRLLEGTGDDERAAIIADLHNMAAEMPPGARAILARAFAEID